jgi:hypothetical protein
MQGRLLRLWLAALLVSLTLAAAPVYASSTQTLSFGGGDFNSCIPTVEALAPSAPPAWNTVLFTSHQFFNASSVLDLDLVSSSKPSAFAATGGTSCLGYTQAAGWFQWIRVQLSENGHVYVAFLQNSTSGSAIVLFNQANAWLSNGTSVGTLTTNHESGINQGEQVFVSVQGDELFVGTISSKGALTYWVNGFGLPSTGLGGASGLTNVAAASGAFASSSHVVAGAYSGNGYAQAEVDPAGFVGSQTITTTTNVILEVVPLIVIVAVVGMVVGMLKKFKL